MPEIKLTFEQLRNLLCFPPRQIGRFHMRYGPYGVPGDGPFRGLRNLELIDNYAEGFEQANEALPRIFRNTQLRGDVSVYVFHLKDYKYNPAGKPFTMPGSPAPRIALSSQSDARNADDRADAAHTAAVHEACHGYQFTSRPRYARSQEWNWFAEATSVFCEEFAFESSTACTDFYRSWLDHPDVPLDHGLYEAGMFARWIARRDGKLSPETIGEIWEESDPDETALQTIEHAIGPMSKIFPQYARDAYFLLDPASPCHMPKLHTWWGLRQKRHHISLPDDDGRAFAGSLDHLSANYVWIDVSEAISSIQCVFDGAGLEAQIAEYRRDGTRGQTVELMGGTPRMAAGIAGVGHYVITISNSSTIADRVPYSLVVRDR